MGFRNTASRYGSVAKMFHWLMFILVIGMLYAGLYMDSLPPSPEKLTWYFWHKSCGVLVLILVILRLTWKWVNPRPLLPKTMAKWQVFAAIGVHTLLYLLMIFMPLSGWLMSSAVGIPVPFFTLFQLPNLIHPSRPLLEIFRTAHELGAFSFIALIALHIGAALIHHFYYRDTVLKRMLPWQNHS